MIFDFSEGFDYGSCWCVQSWEPCWGRPHVLAKDRCYKLGTQGPCPQGQAIAPLDRFSAQCQVDACRQSLPKNAIHFSKVARKWSEYKFPGDYSEPFMFTYKNECYMTETQAFCEPGKVARFLRPYKSPFCVPRDHDECSFYSKGGLSTAVKSECEDGYVEDRARNVCVPALSWFD